MQYGQEEFTAWKNFYCDSMASLNLISRDSADMILQLPIEYTPAEINDVFCRIEFDPDNGYVPQRLLIERDPLLTLNGIEPYVTQLKIAHEISHVEARGCAEKAKAGMNMPRNPFSHTRKYFRECFSSDDPETFIRAFTVWFTMKSINESIADYLSIACFRMLRDGESSQRLLAAEYRSWRLHATYGLQRELMQTIRIPYLSEVERYTRTPGMTRPLIINEIRNYFRTPLVSSIYKTDAADDDELMYETFFENIGSRGLHYRWLRDFWEWFRQTGLINDFSLFVQLLLMEISPPELYYAPLTSHGLDEYARRIIARISQKKNGSE